MQHLVYSPLRANHLSDHFRTHSRPGKVPRVYRIKPHAPPLVRTPVNSFEFHPCGRTPRWFTYRFRFATQSENRTASKHRLGRGLPGYLILFDPHAFVPQRQITAGQLPSQSVF